MEIAAGNADHVRIRLRLMKRLGVVILLAGISVGNLDSVLFGSSYWDEEGFLLIWWWK